MKIKVLTAIAVLIGLVFSFTNTQLEAQKLSEVQAKISPYIFEYFKKPMSVDAPTAPVLVFLKKRADLSFVRKLSTRQEKLKAVYSTLTKTAMESQKDLLGYLKSESLKNRPYYITNMVAVFDASLEQIETIASRSDVARITLNPAIKNALPMGLQTLDENAPKGIESSLIAVGADKVWSEFGVKGENIVVAGQDTGVEWEHPALVRQYRGNQGKAVNHNYNWHDAIHEAQPGNICGSKLKAPCDDNAHGTHTVGTMVGDDAEGNQIGMAPNAQWVACRNMDAGIGTPARYIECFEFFLAPFKYGANPMTDGKPELAPHIINNSWSCPSEEGCEGSEFLPILEALKTAGILVVVSAGNSGSACSTINAPPATHTDLTFTVGAFNHTANGIAYFSSRGPSTFDGGIGPDVVAPGVNIRSAVPGKKYAQSGWSGTSMAGPHVAGMAALLWSKNPELIGKIDETIELIQSTATAKTTTQNCGGVSGSTIPNNTLGYGLINTYKAATK